MFNPVRIFNGNGDLINEFSSEQLHSGHWGNSVTCEGCGTVFSAESRLSRTQAIQRTAHPSRESIPAIASNPVQNLVPETKFCNTRCRGHYYARLLRKENAKKSWEQPCEICKTIMTVNRKHRRWCSNTACKAKGASILRKAWYIRTQAAKKKEQENLKMEVAG